MTTLPRNLLEQLFPGQPRAIAAFDELARNVDANASDTSETVQATRALRDAAFVTLSPNDELPNERALRVGQGLSLEIGPDFVTLRLTSGLEVSGDFPVQITAQGPSAVVLPLTGLLATISNFETLRNKTLAAPKLDELADAVDDAAAATANVPVGGVYRTGSDLKVRVA